MSSEPPSPRLPRNGIPPPPKKLKLTGNTRIPRAGLEIIRKIGVKNLRRATIITLTGLIVFFLGLSQWESFLPYRISSEFIGYHVMAPEENRDWEGWESRENKPSLAPTHDPNVPIYTPPINISELPALANIPLPPPPLQQLDIPSDLMAASPYTRGAGISSPELAHRCSEENRLKRLRQTGGIPRCDQAVTEGLRWFAACQNLDGSWGSTQKEAMTGLALLAFMARCETPYSEEFGETSLKAIAFLISSSQKNNGILSSTPSAISVSYEHAIATYALAESLALCQPLKINVPGLAEALRRAGNYITTNQGYDGSWYYYYEKASSSRSYPDLSITGWNAQALLAARRTRLAINGLEESLNKAISFVKSMANPETGMFAYTGSDYRASMTCAGTLLLQLTGQYKSMELINGQKWIQNNQMSPDYNGADWDLYLQYYCAQVMINKGGSPWKQYAKTLGTTLLKAQNEDGSWPAPANTSVPGDLITANSINGQVYRNALAILTLTTFYRYQITPP